MEKPFYEIALSIDDVEAVEAGALALEFLDRNVSLDVPETARKAVSNAIARLHELSQDWHAIHELVGKDDCLGCENVCPTCPEA